MSQRGQNIACLLCKTHADFLRKKSFVAFVLLQQRKIRKDKNFVLIAIRFKSFPSGNLREKFAQILIKKSANETFVFICADFFHQGIAEVFSQ
jgi:hypothetical protein